MKYTNIAIAVLALSAAAASAGEATAELRWADHANQYKAEFSEKVSSPLGTLVVAGEVETKQGYGDGKLDSLFAGAVGYPISVPYGFTVHPFLQVGVKMNSYAPHSDFISEGVKVSRNIIGPVSGEVQFRHRASYDCADLNENRASASVKYAINKKHAVGFATYTYWGDKNDHRYGVFYKYTL